MKKIFLVSILILFTIISLVGQEDLPGLIAEAGEASDFPDASHLMVFDRTRVKVMDSGLSHVSKEALYKVLTARGALELKSLVFGYDPQSAYVEVKGAKIIKKCGKVIDIPLTGVKDYPAPARGIYWGAREKLLPVGRLEPGEGLWVKTYQKGFTYALLFQEDDEKYIPPMKGHFYDIVHFYSHIPISTKSYELSIPSDKKFQYEFYNGEARHYVHIEGDRNVYFWEKKDIRPIKREPRMVNPSDCAPKLLMSTSPDWEAKSLWFHKVNEDYGSFEYDEEIKKKAEEIIRGAKDDLEKISRLTHWAAEEIRYSGISMGKGEGYTLHKGTMTFRDRCGVCKDKAGMLVTLLRAAGYESYPAMTMAGSRIDRIPADQFNHSVTLVKYKGKYKLLDPTWVPGVRELWSSLEQQQEYLMGIPEGADLKSTPISPPENHFIKYKIASFISPEGDLKAKVEIQTEGQSDAYLRRALRGRLKIERPGFLSRIFYQAHPEIKVSNFLYNDPYDLSKPMHVTFSIVIKNYLPRGKKEAYLSPVSSRPPFHWLFFFSRTPTDLKERKFPFRARCSQWVEIHETLKLPRGFKLLNPEKLKKVEGSGAEFSGDIQQKGNSIIIKKSIKLKKRIYQPEEWKSFRESVLEFKKPDKNILIVTKGGRK
jgi:transglutaminase-like putative cysteine protease